MPVTTRTAALRSPGDGNEGNAAEQPSSLHVSGKRTRKARQLLQRNQLKEHSSAVCDQSEQWSTVERQSSVSQAESTNGKDSHRDDANQRREIETNYAPDDRFPDQEAMLPMNEIGRA